MSGFAGWVGGSHTWEEMKRQLKLMASYLTTHESQSVYLPVGAMIAPVSKPISILQNGTASIALLGEVYWQSKRMLHAYQLSLEEILEAYLHQGAQCLNTFRGQYAIAIILAEHNEVFLACDHFSSYPIFYSENNNHFVFSSQLDSLLSHMAIKPELSQQSIFDYFYHHFIPSPQTLYHNICRVQPGHYVLHRKNRTVSVPYWQCASFSKTASFSKSKQKLKRLLQDSVKQHQRPNSGAFLSGGLDSSTIAGMMSHNHTTHAFTIGFDQDKYDESEYASLVAKHFQLQHHHTQLRADDLYSALPSIIKQMDQPFGNASLIGAYFCAKLASDHGIHHLLAGDGGDELFGGNSRYMTHYWFNKYRQIPKLIRLIGIEAWLKPFSEENPIGFVRKAKKFLRLSKLSVAQRETQANLLHLIGMQSCFHNDFINSINILEPELSIHRAYDNAQARSWLGKLLCMDMKWILADNDIQKVRMACKNQCAVHFPMLDESLVKFAMKLPDHYKVHKQGLRPFYKKAMQDFLPKALMNKPKHGFGVPFGKWALAHPKLKELTYDSLNQFKQRNILQSGFIDQLKDKLLVEYPGFYGVFVWNILALELWLQMHPVITPSFQTEKIISEAPEIS